MRKETISHNGHDYQVVAEYRGFKLVRSPEGGPVCAYGVTRGLNKDGSVQQVNPVGIYNIGPTVKDCKRNLDGYAEQQWIEPTYTVGTMRKAGLDAKWGKSGGRPIIFARKGSVGTFYSVDNTMFEAMKVEGVKPAFERFTLLGDLFSVPA